MKSYTPLFIAESRALLKGLAAILDRLNAGSPEAIGLHEGLRCCRFIKGMALYEQQTDIAVLAWAMERGFEKLSGSRANRTLVADLAAAVPALARMIDEVERHGAPQTDAGGIVATLESTL